MPRFWRPQTDPLEQALRRARHEPRAEFLNELAGRVAPPRPRHTAGRLQRALMGIGVTAAFVVPLSVGGSLGFAATQAQHAVEAVTKAVVAAKPARTHAVRAHTSGGDQYASGTAWGAADLNPAGAPVITKSIEGVPNGEANTLRADPSTNGKGANVHMQFTINSQAIFNVSVFTSACTVPLTDKVAVRKQCGDDRLLLTQSKSQIGSGNINGPQTKVIYYLLRVPRLVDLNLRIPLNLLKPGETYHVRIKATDPSGQASYIIYPIRRPAK